MSETRRLWIIERSNWFGESEIVAEVETKKLADRLARELRKSARAIEDPADKIRYRVLRTVWRRAGKSPG